MDSDLRQLYEKDKQSKTIAITSTVIILLLLITVIILLTLLSPMNVVGESMLPSIKDGEHVLLLKRCYRIERYDVIVFKRPDSEHPPIKRVIGMGGENIRFSGNTWYIDGEPLRDDYTKEYPYDYLYDSEVGAQLASDEGLTVGEDELFVLGDNRSVSYDSHTYGCIKSDWVVGKVIKVY